MCVRQDGALRDRVTVAATQAEGEPVANGISDGIPVASDDEPVLVIANNLLELALRLGFGPADKPVRVMISIIPGDALILQYTIPT